MMRLGPLSLLIIFFNFNFQTSNDHYIITPVASVRIVDGDFLQSNDDSSERSANVFSTIISSPVKCIQSYEQNFSLYACMQAQIFVIPAARVPRVTPERSGSVALWWVIVVSVVGAVIIDAAVGVILWAVSQCKNTPAVDYTNGYALFM